MKIFNDIKLIDLALYTNKTLVMSDFHIGYEEALNKQGVMVPRFQFPEIIKRLENIFLKLKTKKIERIIICGDLKHEFGTISDQEWRNTLKLIDFLGKHCKEIVLIKGNHDTILGPIAKKRNVKVLEHYFIEPIIKKSNKKSSLIKKITDKSLKTIKNKQKSKKTIELIKKNKKILFLHGDKIPNKELLKDVSIIIIGHEHPAVSVKEGPRVEVFKAFLIGKWKRKKLIVLPSFNLVTEGTDVLKGRVLSPLLKDNLRNFKAVIVADKLYAFGTLRSLL